MTKNFEAYYELDKTGASLERWIKKFFAWF